MPYSPSPGDCVRVVGLQTMAALNAVCGTVQPRGKWKNGTVAVLLETDPPKGLQFKPVNLEEAPSCIICLHALPAPIQSGCACRGAMGLAHVACRAELAKRSGEWDDWHTCGTCGQQFTRAMQAELAEEWVGSVAELPDADEDRLVAEQSWANTLSYQHKYAEAEALYRKILAVRRPIFGDDDPDVLTDTVNLASSLRDQRKYAASEAMLRETLARHRRVFGLDAKCTFFSAFNLAGTLHVMGKYAEAEAMFRDILEKTCLEADDYDRLRAVHNLARAVVQQGKLTEAAELLYTIVPTTRRVLGDWHPFTVETVKILGQIWDMEGN
jgi:tetratricopeptide (TPR) repeat protein